MFECAFTETRGHVNAKARYWFTHAEVQHVIILWVRPERYRRRTGGIPAGERPVLVWHFERIPVHPPLVVPVPPFRLAAPLVRVPLPGGGHYPAMQIAAYPVDIGSNWANTVVAALGPGAVPARRQMVIRIPSADLFFGDPTAAAVLGGLPPYPAPFPAHIDMDLFEVLRALRSRLFW